MTQARQPVKIWYMKILYLKKKKGRIYRSEDIIPGLRHGESGAPEMDGCFVSVSDTPLHWAVCVSEVRAGFDMEESSRVISPKAARALHPLEQSYLAAIEAVSSEWRAEFLAIWTAKESYMKFCGEGLRLGASSFSVIAEDMSFSRVVEKKDYPAARLIRLDAPAGITASLCVPADAGPDAAGAIEIKWEHIEYDAPFRVSALEKAAGYLDTKAYASGELREKLKKDGYPDEDINEALRALEERGYLSDEDFARSYAERSRERGKGRLRIRRELAQKGIGRDLIELVLSEEGGPVRAGSANPAPESAAFAAYSPDSAAPEEDEPAAETEFDRALAAALKTAPGIASETDRAVREKLLAKIGRKLSSLGYETSVIYAVFDRLRG